VGAVLYEVVSLSALIAPSWSREHAFQTVSTSIGIPPDGTSRAGLGGIEGGMD